MNTQIVIGIKDEKTANTIQQNLIARHIHLNRFNRDQAIRFGIKLGPIESSPQEFIEIVEASPKIVDALFDTIERFIERISFYVNKNETHLPNRQTLKISFEPPKTFDRLFNRR